MTGRITINTRAASRLFAAIKHHAPELLPITYALFAHITAGCNAEESIGQTRTGANSWYWERKGRRYYFRSPGHGSTEIRVLDAPQNGTVVAVLKSEDQAERFIRRTRRSK